MNKSQTRKGKTSHFLSFLFPQHYTATQNHMCVVHEYRCEPMGLLMRIGGGREPKRRKDECGPSIQ